MSEPFKIDLGSLRTRSKETDTVTMGRIDTAAEQQGFLNREPQRKRGRKPSPRIGQVHAKVMPDVADEIANEAKRRGVQQGVLIEEAWALYKAR